MEVILKLIIYWLTINCSSKISLETEFNDWDYRRSKDVALSWIVIIPIRISMKLSRYLIDFHRKWISVSTSAKRRKLSSPDMNFTWVNARDSTWRQTRSVYWFGSLTEKAPYCIKYWSVTSKKATIKVILSGGNCLKSQANVSFLLDCSSTAYQIQE